jgi:NADH:ubiquinone oxidoreductase subunit 5 (subunit L)/multisubunit Na+/H+ antiporter MnhA subunit
MNAILYIIGLPVLVGIILFLFPEKWRLFKGLIAMAVSLVTFLLAIGIYFSGNQVFNLSDHLGSSGWLLSDTTLVRDAAGYVSFNLDNLCKLIILFISLFAVLINLYSLVYIGKNKRVDNYYEYFLLTLGTSFGAVVSDNLLLFIFFWGILGLTLYRLIRGNDEESSAAAKKTLILIGASDSIMILGIAIIWLLSGTLKMNEITLETNHVLPVLACITLLIGSFTKAGAFPFHTWVPDYTQNAPASSSAYLPASLDKLLGIYFLARITGNLFIMNEWLTLALLTIGVISIIAAGMMALVQQNYNRLLGYSTVSQVGYMILGFGMGSVIGIAAGLFHMINNAIYKNGLFLSAGCVEYRTGKNNLADLGGLSKALPVTFVTALIFALSISGVPPLNGFASKWMIYQSIVDFGSGTGLASKLWILWLALAVFGSALSLASFIKFIGGIFLSRRKEEFSQVKEVPFLMWLPLVILAIFCVVFGVFASGYVIPKLFMPVTGTFEFTGTWNSSFASLLILVSIVLGIIIYLVGSKKKFRTENSFIGGEKIQEAAIYPTPEFYKTFGEFRFFSWMYKKAEEKWFDLYDLCKQFVLWLSHQFSAAHTGVLPGYVIWVFAGLIIMLLIMI